MSNTEIPSGSSATASHAPAFGTGDHDGRPTPPRRPSRGAVTGLAAVAILALGVAGGAGAMKLAKPSIEMAPMTPVAITALPDGDLVTIKGKVVDIFGNKFIVDDGTGRALVETGRAGETGKLVAPNEEVSVQGRFENGFLHASFIVHPDGKTEAVGPAGGPPRHGPGHDGPGRHGPDRDGPRGERGPRDDARGPGPAEPAPAGGPAASADEPGDAPVPPKI